MIHQQLWFSNYFYMHTSKLICIYSSSGQVHALTGSFAPRSSKKSYGNFFHYFTVYILQKYSFRKNCHYIDDIRFSQQMNGLFFPQNWLPWIQNTLIQNSSMPILPTFLLQIFRHPWLRLRAAMPMPPSPRSRACPRSCLTGRVFPSLVPLLTIHR